MARDAFQLKLSPSDFVVFQFSRKGVKNIQRYFSPLPLLLNRENTYKASKVKQAASKLLSLTLLVTKVCLERV